MGRTVIPTWLYAVSTDVAPTGSALAVCLVVDALGNNSVIEFTGQIREGRANAAEIFRRIDAKGDTCEHRG